jgi:hypothetical protein
MPLGDPCVVGIGRLTIGATGPGMGAGGSARGEISPLRTGRDIYRTGGNASIVSSVNALDRVPVIAWRSMLTRATRSDANRSA